MTESIGNYRTRRRPKWDDHKTCSKCNVTFEEREFYTGDAWCKECRKKDALNRYHEQKAPKPKRKYVSPGNYALSQRDYYLIRKQAKENDDGTTLESVREKIDKMHVYVTSIRNGRPQELPQEFVSSTPVRRQSELVQDGDRWIWT